MSSPSGIEGLGASGRILLSSTSVFGEVLFPFAGVDPGVWAEGLLPRFSDGEDLFEDMVGVCVSWYKGEERVRDVGRCVDRF